MSWLGGFGSLFSGVLDGLHFRGVALGRSFFIFYHVSLEVLMVDSWP